MITIGIHPLRCQAGTIAARKKQRASKLENFRENSDDTFYYIAGYTPGGAPFGVTWEEMEGVEF